MSPYPEPEVNRRDEDQERKGGAGVFASLVAKLGLGGGSGSAGAGLGVGGAGAGLSGGLLATKAGVVALVLAGTTVAAGIGVVGRSALTGTSRSGGVSGAIYSLFPGKGAGASGAGQAAAPANGASSSLDYLAQAVKGDAALQEQVAAPPGAASEGSALADGEAAGQVAAPDHSNAPANVASASLGGPRAQLAKMQGLSAQNAGGSGGSIGAPAVPGTGRSLSASSVGGPTSGLSRNPTAAAGGRRAVASARAVRPGDQLAMAARTSKQASASGSPSMQRAGTTFDGSSGIQASAAGVPAAATAGGVGEGERGRFSPNKVVDQSEVPQPPKVKDEKDVTAYKPYQYAAMAGLGVALVLMFLGGKKKDEAKAMYATAERLASVPATLPEAKIAAAKATALYATAKTMLWAGAAAAALTLAMGVIIMTAYGQTQQGLIYTAGGGLLAAYLAYKAVSLREGAAEAKEKDAELAKSTQERADALTAKMKSGGLTEAEGKELAGLGKAGARVPPSTGPDAKSLTDGLTRDAAKKVVGDKGPFEPIGKGVAKGVTSNTGLTPNEGKAD